MLNILRVQAKCIRISDPKQLLQIQDEIRQHHLLVVRQQHDRHEQQHCQQWEHDSEGDQDGQVVRHLDNEFLSIEESAINRRQQFLSMIITTRGKVRLNTND